MTILDGKEQDERLKAVGTVPNSIKAMRRLWNLYKDFAKADLGKAEAARSEVDKWTTSAGTYFNAADHVEHELKRLGYATEPQAGE